VWRNAKKKKGPHAGSFSSRIFSPEGAIGKTREVISGELSKWAGWGQLLGLFYLGRGQKASDKEGT